MQRSNLRLVNSHLAKLIDDAVMLGDRITRTELKAVEVTTKWHPDDRDDWRHTYILPKEEAFFAKMAQVLDELDDWHGADLDRHVWKDEIPDYNQTTRGSILEAWARFRRQQADPEIAPTATPSQRMALLVARLRKVCPEKREAASRNWYGGGSDNDSRETTRWMKDRENYRSKW